MIPETPENVCRVASILKVMTEGGNFNPPSQTDSDFLSGCYPWVQDNTETKDLLTSMYEKCPYIQGGD